jgi:hypothetical protein
MPVQLGANPTISLWAVDLNLISLLRGPNSPAAASFFRNRSTDICRSKIVSWWVCFMLDEPLRERHFPH